MASLIRHEGVALLAEYRERARADWARWTGLDSYYQGRQGVPYTPESATPEYRQLQRRSITNLVQLIINLLTQGLIGKAYTGATPEVDARQWARWQAAGLDSKQVLAHRRVGVVTHCQVATWPDAAGETCDIRPLNPLATWGHHRDPDDHHPAVLLRRMGSNSGLARGSTPWEVWTPDRRYFLSDDRTVSAEWEHDLGHTPATRLVATRGIDGEPTSEVTPLRQVQDRVNESVFTLLMAQTFQAFRQRWVVGADPASLGDLNPGVDRVYVAPGKKTDVQWGEFGQADLQQIIGAIKQGATDMVAIAQAPPQVLGLADNLSADAIVAAEFGYQRRLAERRANLGECWEEVLRDAAWLVGDDEAARDTSAQLQWANTEARPFTAMVDGLTKLTSGDNPILPVELARELVPGLTQQDVERAARLAAENPRTDAMATLMAGLAGAAEPAPMDPAEAKARADGMGVLIRAGVKPESAARMVGLDGVEFTGAIPTSLRVPEAQAAELEGA